MYSFGMRFDNDSNAITTIDEVNETAVTKGYVNGEYVEFGGGSSDFSTAEVTISGLIAGLSGAFIAPYDFFETDTSFWNIEDGNATYTVMLYKGKAMVTLDARGDISTSGAIESISVEDGLYLITGDCTITTSI